MFLFLGVFFVFIILSFMKPTKLRLAKIQRIPPAKHQNVNEIFKAPLVFQLAHISQVCMFMCLFVAL